MVNVNSHIPAADAMAIIPVFPAIGMRTEKVLPTSKATEKRLCGLTEASDVTNAAMATGATTGTITTARIVRTAWEADRRQFLILKPYL